MSRGVVINDTEVQHLINGLNDFEKDRALYSAMKTALNVIRQRGKALLKERTKGHGKHPGLLEKSISVKTKKNKLGALVGFKVVNFNGKRSYANHSHLINRGTGERYTKKRGRRGKVKATHFWDDAPIGQDSKVQNQLQAGIEKAINRIKAKR